MPLKVSIRTVSMLRDFKDIQERFNRDVEAQLPEELLKQIQSGLSPVKGQGRFADYADSYKDEMDASGGVMRGSDGKYWTGKKPRPVNLTVSGRTLKTLKVKVTQDVVNVSFTSKIAGYHNDGNQHLPRRALLPTGMGEDFSSTIRRFLVKIAKKIVDKVLK